MAARKSKRSRKKAASRSRARKKAPRKKAARKRAPRKKAARKKAARKRAARPARKAAPRTPSAEAVARKIVRVTQDPARLSVPELYTEDCVSVEPGPGDPAVGHAAIQAKNEFWEQLQDSSKARWTARNVLVKRNRICIEWDGEVTLRASGRAVSFPEVAVHELRGGKIARERYYYDPSVLAGGAAEAEPEPEPVIEPPAPEPQPTPARSVDPIDL